MKVAIIVGTRPEIIKLAPVIKEYQKRQLPFILIHSNQHYSANMDEIFFQNLELPQPHYNLNIGPGSHAQQTAKILTGLETIFLKEKIDLCYVQGDTNTVLAGGLAAVKMRVKVAHVEAGLRSNDFDMPEEINRIIVDRFADYLFAVTEKQKNILLHENIDINKIHIVGNTVVDSLFDCVKLMSQKKMALYDSKLKPFEYFLVTAHRPSNVDSSESLQELINTLEQIAKDYNKDCLWPIHPRSENNIKKFNIALPSCIKIIPPVGYFDFVHLMQKSKALITDSGGIQEEACILKIPCITLRSNTERPESVEVGANFLCGRNYQLIRKALDHFFTKGSTWQNPFGDGHSAKRIVDIIHSSNN